MKDAKRKKIPFKAKPDLRDEILRLRNETVAASIYFSAENSALQIETLSEQDKAYLGYAAMPVLHQWQKRTHRMSKLARNNPQTTMQAAVRDDTVLDKNGISPSMKVSRYLHHIMVEHEGYRAGFEEAYSVEENKRSSQQVQRPHKNDYGSLRSASTETAPVPLVNTASKFVKTCGLD